MADPVIPSAPASTADEAGPLNRSWLVRGLTGDAAVANEPRSLRTCARSPITSAATLHTPARKVDDWQEDSSPEAARILVPNADVSGVMTVLICTTVKWYR